MLEGSDLLRENLLHDEWLETNRLGGYSSSTLLNCHTRKYHGFLVTKSFQTNQKSVLLSKFEDIIYQENQKHYLSASQYPDFFQDGSTTHLIKINYETYPSFIFQFGQVILKKEILMLQDEDTLLVKYSIQTDNPIKLSLNPLLAFRNFHELTHENSVLDSHYNEISDGISFHPYQEMPDLIIQSSQKFEYQHHPDWYRNFEYSEEKNRGYDFREDLFSPGEMIFSLNGRVQELLISISVKKQEKNWPRKWLIENNRRQEEMNQLQGTQHIKMLRRAGRLFFQKNPHTQELYITAGYHWFDIWGRDTMIALPGLTLFNGREKDCLPILLAFANKIKNGLLPNILNLPLNESAYHSVDTSLWFVWSIQQYYLKTRDIQSIQKSLWQSILEIFEQYQKGTLFNIKMAENGLIYAGNNTTNLTWMDVKIQNNPVTPRAGAAVEVNALWFNMINFMHELALEIDKPLVSKLKPLIEKVKGSFRENFWNEELGYLKDFIDINQTTTQPHTAIRPNQLFAISLPYSPVTKKIGMKIFKVVTDHLLTPYGLRSLSPHDPNYMSFYNGNTEARDQAYHNGTVWPWLLAAYGDAAINLSINIKQLEKQLTPCISALMEQLEKVGMGCISEIFDGESPHLPRGCINQAWNVGELLRLISLMSAV